MEASQYQAFVDNYATLKSGTKGFMSLMVTEQESPTPSADRSSRISKLFSIDRKSGAARWHEQVEDAANGILPASIPSDGLPSFPWAQLRAITDSYLVKQKVPASELDGHLYALVHGHLNQPVAIAACSHRLSHRALLGIIRSLPQNPVDDHLQAFVAATQCSSDVAFVNDGQWAALLFQMNHELPKDTLQAPCVEVLFAKWCSPTLPAVDALFAQAVRVTSCLCRKLNLELEAHRKQRAWVAAHPIANVLSRLLDRPDGISVPLEELLNEEVPTWRSWARWEPSIDRLKLWEKSGMTGDTAPLWTLLGPDFESFGDIFGDVYASARSYQITSGKFTQWLESKGIVPGPGLSTKNPSEQTGFSNRLFRTVDHACRNGSIARSFLRYLCLDAKLGLDDHALSLYEHARDAFFTRAPAFLAAVLEGSPEQYDITITISKGLNILNDPCQQAIRAYLLPNLRDLLAQTLQDLNTRFLEALHGGDEWIPSAESCISFCILVATYSWLQPTPVPSMSLQRWLRRKAGLIPLHALDQELKKDNEIGISVDFMRSYIIKFVQAGELDGDTTTKLVCQLHALWTEGLSSCHRTAALAVCSDQYIAISARVDCIKGLPYISGHQADKLELCIARPCEVTATRLCQRLLRIAATMIRCLPELRASCQTLVRQHCLHIEYMLHQKTFTDCSLKKYRNWINNLWEVFGDSVDALQITKGWLERLLEFQQVIEGIRALPSAGCMHCIYTAVDSATFDAIIKMLKFIRDETRKDRKRSMQLVMLSLTDNKKYVESTSLGIDMLSKVSDATFEQCRQLCELADGKSLYVAAVQLDVWRAISAFDQETLSALSKIALAIHLPTVSKAETAKDYYLARVADLMKKARHLEMMKVKLKRTDKAGVSALLSDLKIEDTANTLDDDLIGLPGDIVNLVDLVDDSTVELSFPLTRVKAIQRKAMGLSSGESIIVRATRGDNMHWESFCVHVVDSQTKWQALKHSPMKLDRAIPHKLPCEGRDTRISYNLMRLGWVWIQGRSSLREVYRAIEGAIRSFGRKCIVCNQNLRADLYRPTLCGSAGCHTTWLQSSLEVRLSDLRLDDAIVELLLSAVEASATRMITKSSFHLLPTRPARLLQDTLFLDLLNKTPSIASTIKSLEDLYTIRTKYSIRAELLFSWLCNGYRGFLISANQGWLRIPNMPNVLQFVLADSPPEIATAFAQHDGLLPRQVLFHGTSMDRLWPILCQGLKVLSNTGLQSHGAAYGKGIYLAENPATAVGYCSQVLCQQAAFVAQHGQFVNRSVLLGIEYAGSDASRGNGIHVATDPTKLLLRYIFLLPVGFKAPLANHVVPAMLSNFATLRSGAKKV